MKVENRARSDLTSLSRTAFFSIKQIAEFDIFWLLGKVQKKIISKKKITSRGRSTRKQDADNTRCWQRKDNWSRGMPPLPLLLLSLYLPSHSHRSFLSSALATFDVFALLKGVVLRTVPVDCWQPAPAAVVLLISALASGLTAALVLLPSQMFVCSPPPPPATLLLPPQSDYTHLWL